MSVAANCPECGATFRRYPSGQPSYCSRACASTGVARKQREAGTARRARTCPECRKQFEVPRSARAWQKTWCSGDCHRADGKRKIETMIARGDPIIAAAGDTLVMCLVCGKKLRQAGPHFVKLHGIDTSRASTHGERQLAYGVTQGTRMVARDLLAFYRERARDRGYAKFLDPKPNYNAETRSLVRAPPSPAQRAINTSPEHIARCAAGLRATRARKYWNSRSGDRWHRTITCGQCGRVVRVPRVDGNKRFCKEACYREHKRNAAVHVATVGGVTKTLYEWAREKGLDPGTLRARIVVQGWDPERAVLTPARKHGVAK